MDFRRRSLSINIALALLITGVVALLAEVVLRLATPMLGGRMDHYSPYGPRYMPHSLLTNDERGSTCVDRVNNIGFHDREFLFQIPDTVRRVALFGDSFVEAAQVVAESIFFNVFEDLRNVRGWRCDAAGFGMSGNSADQEFFRSLHVMQQGRVDDIVYVFFANDFLDGYQQDLKPPAWPFLVGDAVGPLRFAGRYQYEDYLWSTARLTKLLVPNSYLVSFVCVQLLSRKTVSLEGGSCSSGRSRRTGGLLIGG
jgi:hypothetical protein